MIFSTGIHIQTKGNTEVIDITSQVADRVRESGAKDGTVTVFVPGSTAGVSTIEYEGGLVADIHSVWERIAPREIPYRHDAAWGDGNGHSHIRSFLLGPSLVVPFVNRRLTLGTWQQIVLVDFDNRPRSRDIVVQIMGD